MKMTIESFEAKQKQFEAKRKEISDSIADLSKQEAALAEECKAAVEAGDVDTYIKKNREKEDVSSALFVKRSFLDKMGKAVTEADAKEAWANYVEGYNKDIQKALADYEKTRSDLLRKYKDLVEKQAAALKVRDHLNESVGLANPDRSFPMMFIPCLMANDPGSLSKGRMNAHDPDLLYYIACKERAAGSNLLLAPDIPETKDTNKVFDVVARHRAD